MSSFKCSTCNKQFRNNWYLTRHINRKNPCLSKNEGGVNLVSIRCQNSVIPVSIRCQNSVSLVSSNIQSNSCTFHNTSVNGNNLSNSQSPMTCLYCNKTFTRTENCYRHMKHRCKKKKEYLENEKKLNNINELELDARKKELEYKINKTTTNNNSIINNDNSNNTNNIQVNNNYVNINPLGQEDISFLTKKQMVSLINERYNAFNAIQRKLGDNPSNINYYLKDNKYVKYVNEDNQLVHGRLKDIMNQQVCYGIDKIIDMYELVKDELTRKQRKQYEKMINESLNGDINNKYSEELGLIMLDNRDVNKKFLESDKPLTITTNASIPSGYNEAKQATVAIDASIPSTSDGEEQAINATN